MHRTETKPVQILLLLGSIGLATVACSEPGVPVQVRFQAMVGDEPLS